VSVVEGQLLIVFFRTKLDFLSYFKFLNPDPVAEFFKFENPTFV